MDLELDTLKYMSKYTVDISPEEPQMQDYTAYAKRIRKVTRNILLNKDAGYPEHIRSAFIEYASVVVSYLSTIDQNTMLQEEYKGLTETPPPVMNATDEVDVVTATVQLLGTPSTPECAVKQGLGIKTIKPHVGLPAKRKGKK